MKKFIVAKNCTIKLNNYLHGCPYVGVTIPMALSFFDLIYIIKLYTNYDDTYNFDFHFVNSQTNLLSRYKKDDLDNIKIREGSPSGGYITGIYGKMEFDIGFRGFSKYAKVYPVAYQAQGIFPTINEFIKNMPVPNMDKFYTKDDLQDFNEKLKIYFKSKYKISDEKEEGSFFEENKLIKK
jgi:hypothetical protein